MLLVKQKLWKIMQCGAVCQGGAAEICAARFSLHQHSRERSFSPTVCGIEM